MKNWTFPMIGAVAAVYLAVAGFSFVQNGGFCAGGSCGMKAGSAAVTASGTACSDVHASEASAARLTTGARVGALGCGTKTGATVAKAGSRCAETGGIAVASTGAGCADKAAAGSSEGGCCKRKADRIRAAAAAYEGGAEGAGAGCAGKGAEGAAVAASGGGCCKGKGTSTVAAAGTTSEGSGCVAKASACATKASSCATKSDGCGSTTALIRYVANDVVMPAVGSGSGCAGKGATTVAAACDPAACAKKGCDPAACLKDKTIKAESETTDAPAPTDRSAAPVEASASSDATVTAQLVR